MMEFSPSLTLPLPTFGYLLQSAKPLSKPSESASIPSPSCILSTTVSTKPYSGKVRASASSWERQLQVVKPWRLTYPMLASTSPSATQLSRTLQDTFLYVDQPTFLQEARVLKFSLPFAFHVVVLTLRYQVPGR